MSERTSLACRAATDRRRLDTNQPRLEAYQRAGESLPEARSPYPQPRSSRRLRKVAVKLRQQGLELAKFGRPLVSETIDRAHQESQADFLRQTRKRLRIEQDGVAHGSNCVLPLQREIALGAISQYLHRRIGPRKPC